jgi:hypothetical protein
MLTSRSRTGLFAGFMTLALAMPAVASEPDLAQAEANATDLPVVVASTAPAGPVVDRASLSPVATPAAAATAAGPEHVDMVGAVEPTRSMASLQALKRARAARAARIYSYANGNGYRAPALILGVRF